MSHHTATPHSFYNIEKLGIRNKAQEPNFIPFGATNLIQPLTRDNVEQWLEMSHQTRDPDAALDYAQRAADARPDDPRVQETVLQSVLGALHRDPFVAFVAENEKNYIITFRNSRPVVVPKVRAQPDIFPPSEQTDAERILGKVWWLLLGLIPAGIGAVLLSPILFFRAWAVAQNQSRNPYQQRLALLTCLLACVIGLVGTFFTLMLLLHLIG